MTDSDRTAPGTEPAPAAAGAGSSEQALVLTPPAPVPAVTQEQASASTKVDDPTSRQIDAAVGSFVDSLVALDVHSPDFQAKVQSVTQMGNQEIRRSSEVSNRFLDRPAA